MSTAIATTIIVVVPAVAAALAACSLAVTRARRAQESYERACREYATLVDHRLANPLTAISGAATILLDGTIALDDADARQLLEMILDQARRIERTSLSPRVVLGNEELCLAPRPRRPALAVAQA